MLVFPVHQTVTGTSASVDLKVAGANDVGSYDFVLTWDASILDLVSVANGTFLGSTGRSVTCSAPEIAAGSVHFGCQTTGAAAGPGSSGVLATLQFAVVGSGETTLSLSADLSTTTGQPIAINTGDGTITAA